MFAFLKKIPILRILLLIIIFPIIYCSLALILPKFYVIYVRIIELYLSKHDALSLSFYLYVISDRFMPTIQYYYDEIIKINSFVLLVIFNELTSFYINRNKEHEADISDIKKDIIFG